MSTDRVNDLRHALGQSAAPPMPAASTSSRSERIASVSGGPLGSTELDTMDIALVVDDGLPPLVMVTTWDGTSRLAATAALPLPIAERVRQALDEAIARGLAAERQERQEL